VPRAESNISGFLIFVLKDIISSYDCWTPYHFSTLPELAGWRGYKSFSWYSTYFIKK